ncbi:hypothetical protein ACFYLL_17640 [Proteus mirabilis]|uniref:hypothetical protein n=1 Tax=Proteus mirabilis TaxID=584 RepID=UPI00369337CE|nr:hypothetical protein [Proteus mirabilis]
MLSTLMKLISIVIEIFNSLTDEQKEAVTNAIAELYDAFLRMFFNKYQEEGFDNV